MFRQAKAIVNGSTFENIDRLAVSFDRDGFQWPVPHFEARYQRPSHQLRKSHDCSR
jgi:hypothetical protein